MLGEENLKTLSHNEITWIDIFNPTDADLLNLKEKYDLHPLIARQFLPAIHRPNIEEHNGQLFIILHFPVYHESEKRVKSVELDIIIFKEQQIMVTSRKKVIPSLKTFFGDCEVQEYHQKHYFNNVGTLLYGMLDFVIDDCLPMLDHVTDNLDRIENNVFKRGHEREMLNEITNIKRDLIDFRRSIKPQRSVIETLIKKNTRFFGVKIESLAQEVLGSNIRVWNALENLKELVESIEQTNNSLLSYKMSDIMKFLTVVSFITFPLSIIVGFFGMNVFENVLIISHPLTWMFVLLIMCLAGLIMYLFFKIKKWL